MIGSRAIQTLCKKAGRGKSQRGSEGALVPQLALPPASGLSLCASRDSPAGDLAPVFAPTPFGSRTEGRTEYRCPGGLSQIVFSSTDVRSRSLPPDRKRLREFSLERRERLLERTPYAAREQ
jgi:hypothetical protein